MKTSRTFIALMIGFSSLALLASGAGAEWLVTSDGSKLEIKGPWKVEGELVTFILPNGTLGSMPVSTVDLESSRALAEAAATPVTPAETPDRPKAVMVITDADVGHPNLARPDATEADEPLSAASEAPALRVTGWRENVDLSKNSVQITGMLQNHTANPATSLELTVLLYDAQGGLLESSGARLEQGFLNPGASIRFEASFRETLSYDSVGFDIRSRGFMSNPPADDEAATEGEEADDSPVE